VATKDLYGQALYDYYVGQEEVDLYINTSYGDVEEMPVEVFFRNFEDLPKLEILALEHCKGKVLDVGAGTGCHSIILQDWGLDVTPIDISPNCIKIMQARGVEKVQEIDFFRLSNQKFDTLLFLMNGLGIVGKLERLPIFLEQCKKLLLPKGKVLFDTSDVSYLIDEYGLATNGNYIGEIAYQYVYKNEEDSWFNWLYIAKAKLESIAQKLGWQFELIYEDGHGQYLAALSKD